MLLILHDPSQTGNQAAEDDLSAHYRRAFSQATEILVVNAYLTEWDSDLELNGKCRHFRMIIGKDFGVTRKAACRKVLDWLRPSLKANFFVAERIGGFHPKAVFWREADGSCHTIVGSSNLTTAAFYTNFEANAVGDLTKEQFRSARKWVGKIELESEVITPGWIERYNEAKLKGAGGGRRGVRLVPPPEDDEDPALALPRPRGMAKVIQARREALDSYQRNRRSLERLFRRCASGHVDSNTFYERLPDYWGFQVGDRLQGKGYEIKGKRSDFHALTRSFVTILDTDDDDRDDVVVQEIDSLAEAKVPTRRAFLSEMLCLRFPALYPVVNAPVEDFLKRAGLRPDPRSSEGAVYVDLARKLRKALRSEPDHPAKDLAELDTVIWLDSDLRK